MTLQIKLPSDTYSPGSHLTGIIKSHPNPAFSLQSIKLQFHGRCKSKYTKHVYGQSKSVYRGRAPLCQHELSIYETSGALQIPSTFPFSFKIPEHCNASQTDRFDASSDYDTNINQPLPASFEVEHKNYLSGKDIKAFISYELEAIVILKDAKGPITVMAMQRLNIVPARTIENPDPDLLLYTRPLICASLYLIPEYSSREPTFKEKMKMTFRSSDLPTAIFQLRVKMPKSGVLGTSLPISLSISYDKDKSTAETAPEAFLKKATVTIKAETGIRCTGIFRTISEDWKKEQVIPSPPLLHKPLLDSETVDLRELMDLRLGRTRPLDSKVWEAPCPSFKTFCIRRAYELDLSVEVECARKRYTWEFVVREFLLLPKGVRHDLLNGDCKSSSVEYEAPPRTNIQQPHRRPITGPMHDIVPRLKVLTPPHSPIAQKQSHHTHTPHLSFSPKHTHFCPANALKIVSTVIDR